MNITHNLQSYKVEVYHTPTVSPSQISDETASYKYDWLIKGVVWIATLIIARLICSKLIFDDGIPWWCWIIITLLPFGAVSFVMEELRANRSVGLAKEQTSRNQEANKNEAIRTSKNARNVISSGYEEMNKLVELTNKIDNSIKKSEEEFRNNAFSPFWDNIEIAINQFAEYNAQLGQFPWIRDEYYALLKNREHNFPEFPVTQEMLPNIELSLNEFKRVVRLGQTNFEFASIYEHRKTREVIIAGFKNLREALDNIGLKVIEALREFERQFVKKIE